jgi:hypothetical protein
MPCAAFVLAATMIGAAAPVHGQAGLPLRGHLSLADGSVVLEPCGTLEAYTVTIAGELGAELVNALGIFGGSSRARIFVDIEGWIDTGGREGAAAGFAGAWTPTRIAAVEAEAAADCRGEPPPLWLGSVCAPLSPPDLECAPATLVDADLRLARYLAEARRVVASGEVAAAHAAWERNRERRCAATRPGGTVDALWVLTCRVGMSRARLQAIWDDHLKGTAAALPDPGASGR